MRKIENNFPKIVLLCNINVVGNNKNEINNIIGKYCSILGIFIFI